MAIHPKYTDPNSPDYDNFAVKSQKYRNEYNVKLKERRLEIYKLIAFLESSPLNGYKDMEHYINSCKTILREACKRPFAQHID